MAVLNPKITYTPVKARGGRKVHALAFAEHGRVICGRRRPRGGWLIPSPNAKVPDAALPGALLNCKKCKELLVYPVKGAR